jgi:integrase
MAFTQARVAGLRGPAGEWLQVYDETLPGLCLRVTPTGVKIFCVVKRVKGGQIVRVTLGRFPSLNVETARTLAVQRLGELADGVHPNEMRRQEQATQQEEEACRLTLRQGWKEYQCRREGRLAPKTLSEYGRMFRSYLGDWLERPMVEITRDGVERRHARVTRKHGPGAANHCFRALRAVLNFVRDLYETADGRSILPDNPVRRLTAMRAWNRTERRRTFVKEHEVPALWQGLEALRAKAPDAADLFTLCFLTGMRPGEAARLRVDKVDLTARTLEVDKTKNRTPLVLPLTDYVYALLERRTVEIEGNYVFPGPGRSGHLVEYKHRVQALRRLAGLPGFIVYDLRRTYLTVAESLDLATYALKALVNHRQPQDDVTGGYLHLTPERLRKPAQQVEDKLLRMAGVKPGAEVVAFPTAQANEA